MRTTIVLSIIAAFIASPAFADHDRNDSRGQRLQFEREQYHAPMYRGNEFKEEYRDGSCKIEREWKRDGSYKEERKCDGQTVNDKRAERKEEFWDGDCKVERKWEKDGGYKEERKC